MNHLIDHRNLEFFIAAFTLLWGANTLYMGIYCKIPFGTKNKFFKDLNRVIAMRMRHLDTRILYILVGSFAIIGAVILLVNIK